MKNKSAATKEKVDDAVRQARWETWEDDYDQRMLNLWLQQASPTPWRIDKDNSQGIEIVADNGDLVAIEDFGGIPTERGASFADRIIGTTRANFHSIVLIMNRFAAALRAEGKGKDDENKQEGRVAITRKD